MPRDFDEKGYSAKLADGAEGLFDLLAGDGVCLVAC